MTPVVSPLRFDPDLQEAVVLREVDRRRREGDRAPDDEYRKAADQIYTRHSDPSSRHAAFQALHSQLFEKLGCGRPIADVLERLDLRFDVVLVARAWSVTEEEVDLGADGRTLGIRLTVDRFGSGLRPLLSHELGHVVDMLDPAFGYRAAASPVSPTARRSMGDRFGILWDCAVDGRIARAGDEPPATRAARLAHFQRLFPEFSPETAEIVVGRLWDGTRPTYAELVTFARDATALADWCGVPTAAGAVASESGKIAPPVPGAPCPLCGFPTFAWERNIPEDIAARIAADFPEWSPAYGACERCVEGYAVMVEVGGVG